MILDEYLEFTDAGAIPGAAGTALVGDVIDQLDLGNGSLGGLRDLGAGQPIYWYVSVGEAGAGGTSAQFQLISSDATDGSNPTVHASSGVIALADLDAGTMPVMMAVPAEGPAYKRYVGLQAVTVGTFTGGTISSGLTPDQHGARAYPEGAR